MPKPTARLAVAIYSIFIGLFMFIFWVMLAVTGQILPEQIPYAISFHLAGELGTAVLLITSGLGLLKSKRWSMVLSPAALGMLLYTVVVSPGYYAQLGEAQMVVMFSVLIGFTLAALAGVFRVFKSGVSEKRL